MTDTTTPIPEPVSSTPSEEEVWEEVRADDGSIYYANVSTHKTTWEKPVGVTIRQSSTREDEYVEPEIIAELDDGWVKLLDRASGRPYYANKDSRVVQWHAPGEVPIPSPRSLPRFSDHRRLSSSTNPSSSSSGSGGESGPKLETPRASITVVPPRARPSLTQSEVGRLSPGDFDKVFDVDSGEFYWVHRETLKVIFFPPPGWTDSGSSTTTPSAPIRISVDCASSSDTTSTSVSTSPTHSPSTFRHIPVVRDQKMMAKRYSMIIPAPLEGEFEDWKQAGAIDPESFENNDSDDEEEGTPTPLSPTSLDVKQNHKSDLRVQTEKSDSPLPAEGDGSGGTPQKARKKVVYRPFPSSNSELPSPTTLPNSNSSDRIHSAPPPVPSSHPLHSKSKSTGSNSPLASPPPVPRKDSKLLAKTAQTFPPPPPRSPRGSTGGYATVPGPKHPHSHPPRFKASTLPPSLKNEIARFRLTGYLERHFRVVKKRQGLHSRKVDFDELLRWQGTVITKSLLNSSKKYNEMCKEIFKYILQFMGDLKNSTKSPTWLAKTIVSTGVKYPVLRDEIYGQLCKQTNKNDSLPSRLQGWKLMALCAATFPPNREFQDYLLNYISKNYEDSEELIGTLVPWCYWRLQKTIREKGPDRDYSLIDIDNLIAIGIPSSSVLFGSSLDYIMQLQKLEGKTAQYPEVLPVLFESIKKLGGFQTKGIFRLAAGGQDVINLKKQLEKGDFVIKETNVFTPADVVKIWLRELSDPLIPKENYEECLKMCDNKEQILKFVATLPEYYRETLEYLLVFLVETATHADVTSMTEENLAIVFCSNLLKPMKDVSEQSALSNSTKESKFTCNLIKAWTEHLLKQKQSAGT